MQYMGSKNKIAKKLLEVINGYMLPGQAWVEPFVGGGNMIDKVYNSIRIGADIDKYLIALLDAVSIGWIPPTEVTREEYYNVKNHKDNYPDYYVGFVGYLCSFGGKLWGGYAKNSKGDNYAERGSRVLVKQGLNLSGVKFIQSDYRYLEIPENSLIYCDPPYRGTTGYKNSFDHDEFWQWCRDKSEEGHIVFISEYNAPDDFKCLLSIDHTSTLNKNKKDKKIEKLFIHDSLYKE